jgi:hypothetical protein
MPETDPISTDNTALGGILQQQMPGMLAGNKTLQEKVQALPNTLKKIEAEGTAKEQPYQDKLDKLTADQMRIYQGKPPQTEPTSLIEEWGSPAMLFAIFGSMFTRMPMTSALNAAAAVNKAYQQRDFDAADRAYKQWKESNDLAIKLYEIQSNSLEKAIEKIRSGTKEEKADARADISAQSSMYGWGPLKAFIDAGKDEEVVNLWDTNATAVANMKGFNTKADYLKDLEKRSRDVGQEVAAAQKSGDKDALAAAQKKAADLKQEWVEFQQTGSKKTTGEKPEASHNIEITDAAGKPVFSGAAHKDPSGKWIRDDNDQPVPEGNIKIGASKEPTQAFGSVNDIMARWHEKFVTDNKREPTDDEITAQRAKVTAGTKPPSVSDVRTQEKRADAADAVDSTINLLDSTLPLIKPGVTGISGEVARIGQGLAGQVGINMSTDAAKFEQNVQLIQGQIRNELLKNHYMSKGAIEQLNEIVPGLELFDDPVSVRERFDHLRQILVSERNRLHASPGTTDTTSFTGSGKTSDDPLYPTSPNDISKYPVGTYYVDPRDPDNLRQKH